MADSGEIQVVEDVQKRDFDPEHPVVGKLLKAEFTLDQLLALRDAVIAALDRVYSAVRHGDGFRQSEVELVGDEFNRDAWNLVEVDDVYPHLSSEWRESLQQHACLRAFIALVASDYLTLQCTSLPTSAAAATTTAAGKSTATKATSAGSGRGT